MKTAIRDFILKFIPLRQAWLLLSVVRAATDKLVPVDRILIANKYLSGQGIEIGALHSPLVVPLGAKVSYVDRMTAPELRQQYPELRKYDLVNVDIVDDGESLRNIASATLDFVIANHFLEHCENPIKALENMFRVLKPGGIMYLAIPDKRYTFDAGRPETDFQHLLTDYESGPAQSKRGHFQEWVQAMDKSGSEDEAKQKVEKLLEMNYSIHFHVWTQAEMFETLLKIKPFLGVAFDVEIFLKRGRECIFVLRKAESLA